MGYYLNRIAKGAVVLCLLASPILLTGFMHKHYVVMGYSQSDDEYFTGLIEHNALTGKAKVSVQSVSGALQCQGFSKAPLTLSLQGQRGNIQMTCTDGRLYKGLWEAQSATIGCGSGVDERGHSFIFVFADTAESARRQLEKMRANSKLHVPTYP